MKLLTHNMLSSKNVKGVIVGYPLKIEAFDVKVTEVEFNPEFIVKVIPKIDYSVLIRAAEYLGHVGKLPGHVPENVEKNTDFLKEIHHALLEVEVVKGDLICPESGRRFPITDGIPNMLLNEDEV
ncbi:unnamed protein product [Trichogramma brassicae]|uniref:Multifunctional methyltransferase subunit TRM112-like protein n=1 Tax=Trichogramma brassicae TaxID=86971 RepID=A0A6H5I8A6_9HYME|nr:unnamed protein product [Trichogramma brassicae]